VSFPFQLRNDTAVVAGIGLSALHIAVKWKEVENAQDISDHDDR